MGTSQQSLAGPVLAGATGSTGSSSRALTLALIPSFSDLFFIALIVWSFCGPAGGWSSLLNDADVGWHIRTGDWILANHTVPTHDLFSFSKPAAPWFAWEWLSDVVFSLLFRAAALKGVVLFTGVIAGLYFTIVLRYALWRGANVLIALPLMLLGAGGSAMHFLARPHIFTLLLFPVALWIVEWDRKHPNRYVWLLIPLTALWVNLHGGVLMFLACLGLLVAGSTVEAWRGLLRWGVVRRYLWLFVGCLGASFLNPYGIGLHLHIAEYLSSGWIRNNVQEFQAPTFRSEAQLEFEIVLILGLLVVPLLLRQWRLTHALWILFLAHASLTSLRHAPLFCIVAIPLIAEELTAIANRAAAGRPRLATGNQLLRLGSDLAAGFRRNSVAIAVMVAILALAPLRWPADFPEPVFPTALVTRNAGHIEGRRVLTTDQWGDYLIFRFYPRQTVYVDGRSDFYGEPLGEEYFHLLGLSPGWQTIFERRAFDAVLLPPDRPLVEMLKHSPEWRIAENSAGAILFVRASRDARRTSSENSPCTLLVLKKTLPEANENLQPRRSLYTGERRDERG